MSVDKKIENLAEEILQEYTNCYSEVDKEVLAKMISEAIPSKQTEWISVDERLPEREGKYLVYTYKGGIGFGEFRSYLLNKERALSAPQFDYYVTHWMPLPEPPMMKGGADQ